MSYPQATVYKRNQRYKIPRRKLKYDGAGGGEGIMASHIISFCIQNFFAFFFNREMIKKGRKCWPHSPLRIRCDETITSAAAGWG